MAYYKIKSKYANKCLNIYGDNVTVLEDNHEVCLWTESDTNEQIWSISSLGSGVYVRSAIDDTFGLNVYRSGNPWDCDVYPVSGNETDAKINIIASGNYYKLQLANYPTYYLTAGGTSNRSQVYWTTSSGGDNQLWSFITADVNPTPDSGTLGQPLYDFDDLNNLSDTDLIARCIYSEARGESATGKNGVMHVILNRKNRNTTEFGGSTYKGVILKENSFEGMTTTSALTPDTTSTAWTACVQIAQNPTGVTNPIGTCLWFRTNASYANAVDIRDTGEYINLGTGYREVTEKYVIGGHTFYKVSGY